MMDINFLIYTAVDPRSLFFRLLAYERVGISLVGAYERVGKSNLWEICHLGL